MVVLADELLEGFFDKALAASFQLERSEVEDYHQANQKSAGVLGGLMNLVVNDSCVFLSINRRVGVADSQEQDPLQSPSRRLWIRTR